MPARVLDQMLKVLATLGKAHLCSFSDVAAAFSDDIRCHLISNLFHQMHDVPNVIWWHIHVVYPTFFLHSFLAMTPEPVIEGVKVRGSGGPINSSTIRFVCISGNDSGPKFGFEIPQHVFGGVTCCTVLLKPIF